MSTSKHIDRICIATVALTLVITVLFMCGESLGIQVKASSMPYETSFFDTSYVHTIDIAMEDWESFIDGCESEEYYSCTAVIDGEKYSNIAIRAKGNTSLSSVSTLGSDRYSFKLEFDHYDSGKTLDGLDKLCLNNLIQDNTMMKDYIVYQLMKDFGVDTPLCAFAYLTVNGEDWGLYLAVEGIEDSFLSRNYGSEDGDLYKPDSMSMGGGRGNGKGFDFDDLDFDFGFDSDTSVETAETGTKDTGSTDTDSTDSQHNGQGGETSNPGQQGGNQSGGGMGIPGQQQGGGMTPPGSQESTGTDTSDAEGKPTVPDDFDPTEIGGGGGTMPGGDSQSSGMGSDDVKLKYIDDDADSYSNIFDNAKTNVTKADKKRLIKALKNLSEYTDLEDTVDTEEVIRYFVIHNFVCNGDSYTGSMIHNYYLYEYDGQLSMIPWDYNLAYGTFQGGDASDTVNTSIDSPVSGGNVDDRPMLGWIFSDEAYTEQYHELFGEFIEKWFTNGELTTFIDETADMIRSYVEKDPTKFCTADEFEAGVTALKTFVTLRAEAVSKQLAGDDTEVDTGDLNLSDMGTMNNGGGMDMPGDMGGKGEIPSGPDGEGDASTGDADKTETGTSEDGESTTASGAQEGESSAAPASTEQSTSFSLNSGNTGMPSMPNGNGGGTMPSMPDGNGDGTMPSMPDGNGDGTMPSMPDGNGDGTMPSMPDGNGGGTMPSMPDGFGGNSGSLSSDGLSWIMTGVSALVLAAGIFIAVKKKY